MEKGKKNTIIIIVVICAIVLSVTAWILGKNYANYENKTDNQKAGEKENEPSFNEEPEEDYQETGTEKCVNQEDPVDESSKDGLIDLDLKFLKIENKKENLIYSPLSIKYALNMLKDGTAGTTKSQIENLLGDSSSLPKYNNSKNLALANALFVDESFKDNIKGEYISKLKSDYNSELSYNLDATSINDWIYNNTLGLLNNVVDDSSLVDIDFVLINSLAIDMEWKKMIQLFCPVDPYIVSFANEDFSYSINPLSIVDYTKLKFNNKNVIGLDFGAVINNYDIVNTLGEKNVRKEVVTAFRKWAEENINDDFCNYSELEGVSSVDEAVERYEKSEELTEYVAELNSNYKQYSRSTDFYFYDDNDVKVFAKDLKRYDGVELQYIGIMPKKTDLRTFVNNINASKINSYTSNLKLINANTFDDNYIYIVEGTIPTFKFDYKLDFINDLNKLGVTDVFSPEKADLSPLTERPDEYIKMAVHQAKIEFSNFGITAAADTYLGGAGDDTDCNPFAYYFKVPVKTIDLTFDKPFMFIIRDKDNGSTWFTGIVYEPNEWKSIDPQDYDE